MSQHIMSHLTKEQIRRFGHSHRQELDPSRGQRLIWSTTCFHCREPYVFILVLVPSSMALASLGGESALSNVMLEKTPMHGHPYTPPTWHA